MADATTPAGAAQAEIQREADTHFALVTGLSNVVASLFALQLLMETGLPEGNSIGDISPLVGLIADRAKAALAHAEQL